MQIRSINLLCAMGMRGFALQESSHPQWNDWLRAADSAQMKLSILKLTLLINSGRGPFRSGKNAFTIERATHHLLADCSQEYLDSLAEQVWRDHGSKGHVPPRITKEDWLQARGIRTRLKEACSCVTVLHPPLGKLQQERGFCIHAWALNSGQKQKLVWHPGVLPPTGRVLDFLG